MAQHRKSETEFIQDMFSPMIAVICSYDAEVICRKNNLTFVELIQPFCRITGESKIFDPSNNVNTITNFRIEVKDINSLPPSVQQPNLIKKLYHDSISTNHNINNSNQKQITTNNYDINININTPWFESWRECFIKNGSISDHEFLKHFVACIFVVSTSHIDPLDQFQKLTIQQQPINSTKYLKWFSNNIFNYFVLLHDAQEGEINKAHQIYETLKTTYGSHNCHLLQINSKPISDKSTISYDPWLQYHKYNNNNENNIQSNNNEENHTHTNNSENNNNNDLLSNINNNNSNEATNNVKQYGNCLAASDQDRIKTFINEFVNRGLIPWAEKTIKTLNDQVQSKKGILKSFNLQKKLFGSSGSSPNRNLNTSSTSSISMPNMQQSIVNTANSECSEFQLRRVADLSFMFRLYEFSNSCYQLCRKELLNDTTRLYLAGTLEMIAISYFMQTNTLKPDHIVYIEEAINLYNNVCKLAYYAIRATLLSTEILKSTNYYSKAAVHFLNMSNEETDICGALLLEQAALCFITMSTPMIKKFAFNMSVAASRFGKAGQRHHALRAYLQALSVYTNHKWFKTENHIYFMISRIYFNIKNLTNSLTYIEKIIDNKINNNNNNINDTIETNVIKDYILYTNNINQNLHLMKHDKLPILKIPIINYQNIKVNLIANDNNNNNSNSDSSSNVPKLGKLIAYSSESDYLNNNNNNIESNKSNNQSSNNTINSNNSSSGSNWDYLEQQLYIDSFKSLPLMFSCQQLVYTSFTDNTKSPQSCINEKIKLTIPFTNPLNHKISISEMSLMWTFNSTNIYNGKNEFNSDDLDHNEIIITQILSEITLQARESCDVKLFLQPQLDGYLQITGIHYRLGLSLLNHNIDTNATATTSTLNTTTTTTLIPSSQLPQSVPSISQIPSSSSSSSTLNDSIQYTLYGKQLFTIKGVRLNNTTKAQRSIMYNVDNRLNIKILPVMPLLQIEMDYFPEIMFNGELNCINVYLINLSGDIAINNIKIASNFMNLLYFETNEITNNNGNINVNSNSNKNIKIELNENKNNKFFKLNNLVLNPNSSHKIKMWLKAPINTDKNEYKIDFMFYYENADQNKLATSMKYKAFRYSRVFFTQPSLIVNTGTIIRGDENNLTFNLEIENQIQLSNNFEIRLSKIMCISNKWKIINPLKRLDNVDLNKDSLISIVLKAIKINNVNLDQDISISNIQLLQNSDIISNFDNPMSYYLRKSLDQKEEDKLDLIILWQLYNKEENIIKKNGLYNISFYENNIPNGTNINKKDGSLVTKFEKKPWNKNENNNENEIVKQFINNANKDLNIRTNIDSIKTYKYDNLKKQCIVPINISITNTSNETNWDLLLSINNINKINSKDRIYPINKKDQYLWMGSNAKYILLKPNETKLVNFKICFLTKGVYEICKKVNFDSNNQNNNDTNTLTTSGINNSNNPLINNNNNRLNDHSTNSICVYLKYNNEYIFYKELNSSIIIIS